MKKFTLLFALLITMFAYSQNDTLYHPSTTIDEYNYMTKGYKITLDGGLDIKQGYEVTDMQFIDLGTYTFRFKALTRKSDNSLAGIICVANSKTWANKYYLGIPFYDNKLFAAYQSEVIKFDGAMSNAYALALSTMYANTFNSYYDKLRNENAAKPHSKKSRT